MASPEPRRLSAAIQFGQYAANYRNSRTHVGGESLEVVKRYAAMNGKQYKYGVDIATGAGFTAFAIAPLSRTVVATDLTAQMLEQVNLIRNERAITNIELARVAAENLPFKDASINLVTCRTAPHHFLNITAWLNEVSRVLAPDGVFVLADTTSPEDNAISEWMNRVELLRDPSHVWNLSPSQWESAVEAAGLKVTDWKLCPVHLEFYDWAKRSGMEKIEMENLEGIFLSANPQVKSALNIQPISEGEMWFCWNAIVMRATKS